MSTEVLTRTWEVLREPFIELVYDENLDMLDEFSAEDIASNVIHIVRRLKHEHTICTYLRKNGKLTDYQVKVRNQHKGFVSVSDVNNGNTGVSYTEYYPYFVGDYEDGDFAGLLNLAQMINEAWYHCNN